MKFHCPVCEKWIDGTSQKWACPHEPYPQLASTGPAKPWIAPIDYFCMAVIIAWLVGTVIGSWFQNYMQQKLSGL